MKNKDAIIIVLLVVLLVAAVGVIFYMYFEVANRNVVNNIGNHVNNVQQNTENGDKQEIGDKTENSTQENKDEENNQQNTETEDEEKEEQSSTIDPYAKYKDFKWGSTVAISGKESKLEIKNNKVYLTYSVDWVDNKTIEVKDIKGTPKKVLETISGGMLCFYILTQEGKVYTITDWETTAYLKADMSKYNVIDIAGGKGIVYRNIYYLTADGKLIDQNGDTYEELNKNFVYCFGSLAHVVYIGADDYVYYSKNNDANYIIIKDSNGNKVKAKELYMQNNSNTGSEIIIIATKDNQIIYVKNDGTIEQEKGNIKSINTYKQEYQGIMLLTTEDNKNIIKCELDGNYYSVEKEKIMDIQEGKVIESIHMYKRKSKSSDDYYKKSIELTEDQINKVQSVLSKLQNVSNETMPKDTDVYKVIIKFKTGTESVLKTYPGSRVIMDDVLYSLEGQIIETFDTIANNFNWE